MSIKEGLAELAKADVRVAHNGQDFDERALQKVYPGWDRSNPEALVLDTLLLSRLLYPEIKDHGPNTHLCPPKLRNSHSLKAWGLRLRLHKGDFDGGDWQTWSQEMQDYMMQDCAVLKRMFAYLIRVGKPTQVSVRLEHTFAAAIRKQEDWGFTFDLQRALKVQAELQRAEAEIEEELINTYGDWWEPGKECTVRAPRKVKMVGFPNITMERISPKTGKPMRPYVGPPLCVYEQGAKYTPISRVTFNPGSRDHVRLMLHQRHGWVPKKFNPKTSKGKDGSAIIDDDVLRSLPYPEAARLADYYTILKRLGQLSTGKKAWLKLIKEQPDGQYRIFGRVNTNGAVTGRCTHQDPNMAQAPRIKKSEDKQLIFGREGFWATDMRAMWTTRPGFQLVGFDGSGLELRMLAHYGAKFDGGEYARVVSEEDPHAWTRDTVGTDLMGAGDEGRNAAKTLIYAYLYGAGDEKIGSIILPHAPKRHKQVLGRDIKDRVATRFEALSSLQKQIADFVEANGYLPGLDGRKLQIRKAHAALNTLLQSAGALCMKASLAILVADLEKAGLVHGKDYGFCANVHDEVQADVRPEHVEVYTKLARRCVPKAGRFFKLRCPLAASVSEPGFSWADTH